MALYRNKPSTLSPTIGIDNTVICEFDSVRGIFDIMRENSADVSQNTNHQNMMKRRVGRNGTTNSMMTNPLIVHREVGDEINKVYLL